MLMPGLKLRETARFTGMSLHEDGIVGRNLYGVTEWKAVNVD